MLQQQKVVSDHRDFFKVPFATSEFLLFCACTAQTESSGKLRQQNISSYFKEELCWYEGANLQSSDKAGPV